jgi:uncharacterized membrane protein YeaQ/YmgE (transglycosylase-associated protein family)
MEVWLIALLGIALSFLVKFINRSNKDKALSLKFWARDNAAELIASMIGMVILIMIFRKTEMDATFITEKFPWIKSIPMDLIGGVLAGYLNNTLFYAIIKKFKGK